MTTKDIVFEHISSLNGKVNLQKLTNEIIKNDPDSKWDNSHWSFYRTQITSVKGRYAHLFSDEVKKNLKQVSDYRIERKFLPAIKNQNNSTAKVVREGWPEWDTPSDEEQLLLAKVLLPYIKILAPEIVAIIVEDNNKNFSAWTEQLVSLGIRADIYLWKNSPVVFPGIRRHVGSEETSDFRKNQKFSRGENALCLDDNSYPKEIWSFALQNKRYGMKNPANYSLAHILDHKDFNTRNIDELIGFEKSEDKNLFAGLYTSCVNSVYIPTTFLKPTDHNSKIRKLLIQIVEKYYGSVCNALPHNLSFNFSAIEEQWRLDSFPQPTVVGKTDYIQKFIAYRNSVIAERIKNYSKKV